MTPDLFEGRYSLIRQLGAGGMGVVYEAHDQLLNKNVAIKTIKQGLFSTDHILRFQREASALAALKHPGLVTLFVFGISEKNEPYMVMSLERGKSLLEMLEGRGRLPQFKSINIFIQISEAMQHAHLHGVLHRDLKPGNIIVSDPDSEAPKIVVIDFGIAVLEEGSTFETKAGQLVGTPIYMSPEQIRSGKFDARGDVYALGCIMYQTLTGLLPYEAETTLELLAQKTTGAYAPQINSALKKTNFPRGLEEIIEKALAFSPDDRYQTMDQLKDDLLAFKEGGYTIRNDGAIDTKQEVASVSGKHRPKGLSPLLAGACACACCLVVLVAGAYLFLQLKPTQEISYKISTGAMDSSASPEPEIVPPGFLNGRKESTPSPFLKFPFGASDDEAIEIMKAQKGKQTKIVTPVETNMTGTCFANCELPIEVITTEGCNISDAGLKTIADLPKLNRLELTRETKFSSAGIAALAQSKSLVLVSFSECDLNLADIKAISKLPINALGLQNDMGIDDMAITELTRGCKRLNAFVLNGTAVTSRSVKNFRNFPTMAFLQVKPFLRNQDLQELAGLNVAILDIRGNPNITGKGVEFLAKMRDLQTLFLDSSQASSEAMKKLTRTKPKLTISH